MDIIGLGLHQRESQLCICDADGAITERRIVTSRERFTAVLGHRPRARILLEASTESEWVARHLEALGSRGAGRRSELRADVCHAVAPHQDRPARCADADGPLPDGGVRQRHATRQADGLGRPGPGAGRALHGRPRGHPAQPGDPGLLRAPPRCRQAGQGGPRRLHAETPDDPERHGPERHPLAPRRSRSYLVIETGANARLTPGS